MCDGEGFPAAVAVAAGIKGFAAADGRERLQQADARGCLRRQHDVCAARHRGRGLPSSQALSQAESETASHQNERCHEMFSFGASSAP